MIRRLAVAAAVAAAAFGLAPARAEAAPACYNQFNRSVSPDYMLTTCTGTGTVRMSVHCRTSVTVGGQYLYGSASRTVTKTSSGTGYYFLYCPSDRPVLISGSFTVS